MIVKTLLFHRCRNCVPSLLHHHAGSFTKHYYSTCDFRNLKLITFDMTGTLLTFRKPPFEIYRDFGKKYGIECDSERMRSSFKMQWKVQNNLQPHFGADWEAWWTELVVQTFKRADAQGATDIILKEVASELIDHFKTIECWKLKDGAEGLITALQTALRSKLKSNHSLLAIGIISNFDPRLYGLLEAFKIDKMFSPVILSYEHQISKPSPKIFDLALEAFTLDFPGEIIKPSEALHVGDNYELDYVGAKTSGWKSCLISPKFNILDVPENKRTVVPNEGEIHKDLHSFKEFLGCRGKNMFSALRAS